MFISSPYLPKNQVALMAIDIRFNGETPGYPDLSPQLAKRGITPLYVEPLDILDEAVSSHPDMQMMPMGGELIAAAPNAPESLFQNLKKAGFKIMAGSKKLARNYPLDIAYNVCRVDKTVIHPFQYTDPCLLEQFEKENLQKIQVNQGYAKCSVAILNEKAVVTEDRGIYRKMKEQGFQVFYLEPNYIRLPGLNTGFLGGSSGLYDPETLLVTGKLTHHPQYEELKSFLKTQKMSILELSDEIITDGGSLIPLLTKD